MYSPQLGSNFFFQGESGWLISLCTKHTCEMMVVLKLPVFFFFELKFVHFRGFPGGAVVESLPANAGDTGSSPGLGGSHMPRSG